MKTLLPALSLSVVAGYAAAELVELAGANLPGALNAQNALIAFVVVMTALLLEADYGRKATLIRLPMRARTVAVPARQTVRRTAYAIRRGVDAARLAPPPARVSLAPKASVLHYDRAA